MTLNSDGVSPHPPNFSRDISPNAGTGSYAQPIHQTTTFANFSKNAHIIQQQMAMRNSNDLGRRNKNEGSPRGNQPQFIQRAN